MMDRSYGQLTVYFEDPFWVGVFERITGGKLSVCKVTFGAEPKEYEVLDFVLKHYYDLNFSPAVEAGEKQTADNPKRRQRNARKQQLSAGIGTKSQQALSLQREAMKIERKQVRREQREAQEQLRFEQRRKKRKEKHKGH